MLPKDRKEHHLKEREKVVDKREIVMRSGNVYVLKGDD